MFFEKKYNINNIRKSIIGVEKKVPLNNNKKSRYINFNNASSTPVFFPVLKKVNKFLEVYSSINRGSGYKSSISTEIYDECREVVGDFVNCNTNDNAIIFTKNTTESINKLSFRLNLSKDDVVIISQMEHHSNDLPWRDKCRVVVVDLLKDGSLDMDDLKSKLELHKVNLKLVSITGCSNVTGYINDIHKIASLAHKFGAKIFVDAAQLAPHRKINMSGFEKNDNIDFLAFSAHKMYAPFGSGVLIGPKSLFEKGRPEYSGGGNTLVVSRDEVHWANPPKKDESGTPNVIGALALAESIKIIEEIGFDSIERHETELTRYMIENLSTVKHLELNISRNKFDKINMIGIIPFNVKGMHHLRVAKLLSDRGGIGVRSGSFCAQPYIHSLFKLNQTEINNIRRDILFERYKKVPGLVRISFGMYNNKKEIRKFTKVLKDITENRSILSKQNS